MPPPAAADAVAWPESFGTRFTILVDTEEEFDWAAPLGRDSHAVSHIVALPEAHRRFADRGVPLTYMVDYPIATDPRAIEVLRGVIADGASAIGTQLHAWVNPPFEEALTPANSFAGNLPEALEAAKIDALSGGDHHRFWYSAARVSRRALWDRAEHARADRGAGISAR